MNETPLAASAGPVEPAPRDPLSTDPLLGQVFVSVEAFARSKYERYGDDENITVQEAPGSTFVWLVDRTPTTNGTWRLFERVAGGRARYLLCHAAGYWSGEPFRTLADPIVLEETLQPYGAAERVTYEFSSARGYYLPSHCLTRVVVSATPDNEEPGCQPPWDPNFSVVEVPWECKEHVFRCD